MTIKRISFFSLIFFFFLILLNLLSFAKANQNTILIKKFYEIGQAKLKFFGYTLYDVKLLSDDNIFSFNNEIKIIITYNKNFSKSQIIETSLDQIYKQNKSYPNSHINKYRKLDQNYFDIYFLEYDYSESKTDIKVNISKSDSVEDDSINDIKLRYYHDFSSIINTLLGNTPNSIRNTLGKTP